MFDNSQFPHTLDPAVSYLRTDPVKRFEMIGCTDKKQEYMLDVEVYVFHFLYPNRKEN